MVNVSDPLDLRSSPLAKSFIELFRDMENTLFWIKDAQLRIVQINPAFADWVNLPEAMIIGKSDEDLYYPELAQVFLSDDRKVMATGQAIHRKYELLANRFGAVEWRSTSKVPIKDQHGRVIGTTGTSRPINTSWEPLPREYETFTSLVGYVKDHLAEGVDVADMAAYGGMSIATLTRRFKTHLQLSPGEFINQLRLSHACKLLTLSRLNITEIALESGYESPSAFSRAFKRQMKIPPKKFRQLNGNQQATSTVAVPYRDLPSGKYPL